MDFALLLAPGAGASSDSPALVAVEDSVKDVMHVRRMDFPYRLAGRKAPDRQPVLLEAIVEEATRLADETGVEPTRIFMGGRSMGGRMCSIAVARGLPAAGLVLMSYPLHPPGKPEKLRVDHFPDLQLPVLLVSGTRDSFGTVDEFHSHLPAIPGEVTEKWVEGGDHGMAKHTRAVTEVVTDWLRERSQ